MQTLTLWALLANGGAGFQKELRPALEKRDRDELVGAGLLTCEKRARGALWLEVTDKGWAWAAEHLDAELPKRSTAGAAVLQGWLTRLARFLRANDVALADVLGSQPETGCAPRPAHDYESLRERIRTAYLEVSGGRFNHRALLRDIRARLTDIDRSSLDAALKRMHLEQSAMLMTLDNRQEITAAIRDAEIPFSGERMHILWITR
jgi:hypothetical protein